MVHELNKKILVLLPTYGDTKDSKRIMLLNQVGFEVNVAYFDRNTFVAREPEGNTITKLGSISNGNYLRRVIIFLLSLLKLRKLVKNNDLVYCIGGDLAIYSYFSSLYLNKKFIIDIADIRPIQVEETFSGKLFRFLDAFVTKKSSLLIVTSNGFIEQYYIKKLKIKKLNYYLLENKVDYDFEKKSISSLLRKKIVLGYFGVIRDKWTLLLLENIVSKYPNRFEAVIAGICIVDGFDEILNKCDGIKYLGPYKSPDDLLEIYDKVDVNLIFYPEYHSSTEWFEAKKICKSNRFYEALYFSKPMIAFQFSEDGKDIEKLKVGFNLQDYDIEKAVDIINDTITDDNLEVWRKNISEIENNVFRFAEEYEVFTRKMKELFN